MPAGGTELTAPGAQDTHTAPVTFPAEQPTGRQAFQAPGAPRLDLLSFLQPRLNVSVIYSGGLST